MSDKKLKEFQEQFEAIKSVLDYDPSNKLAFKELKKVQYQLFRYTHIVFYAVVIPIRPKGVPLFEEVLSYRQSHETKLVHIKSYNNLEIDFHYLHTRLEKNSIDFGHRTKLQKLYQQASTFIEKNPGAATIPHTETLLKAIKDYGGKIGLTFNLPSSKGVKFYSGIPVVEILSPKWQAKIESLPGLLYDSEHTPLVVQGYRQAAQQVRIAKNATVSAYYLKTPQLAMRFSGNANFYAQALVISGVTSQWAANTITHQHQLLDAELVRLKAGSDNLFSYTLLDQMQDLNDSVKTSVIPTLQGVTAVAFTQPAVDAWAYGHWHNLSQTAHNFVEQKFDENTKLIFDKSKTNTGPTTPPPTEGLSDTQLWLLQHNILAKPQLTSDTLVNGTKAVLATK